MKTLITLIICLASIKSNGQMGKTNDTTWTKTSNALQFRVANERDTIRTIMLVADTVKIEPIVLSRKPGEEYFKGLSPCISAFTMTTTVAIIGYRVVKNGVQYRMSFNHVVFDEMEYLDDKKNPIPKTFVVLTYADTKQP